MIRGRARSPEDDSEAVKWLRKAAEQGFADAQSNLGFMYANGRGVLEDYVQAYAWYSLAKTGRSELAKNNIEIIRKKMTKEQIAEAQALSAKLWKEIEARKP